MNEAKQLLFLSNGHGEDQIAVSIIGKLKTFRQDVSITAMPIVGDGKLYEAVEVNLVKTGAILPTGGFMRLGFKNLWKDIKGGLIGITIRQARCLKQLNKNTELVVVCGDVFLLLMARVFVDKPIVFYVAAKSAHINGHMRIEELLMKTLAIKVFTRDKQTAEELNKHGVSADFLGNPALDAMECTGLKIFEKDCAKVIGFLPGTREDAYENINYFLDVIKKMSLQSPIPFRFILSFYSGLSLQQLAETFGEKKEWRIEPEKVKNQDVYRICHQGVEAYLVQGHFGDILQSSDIIVGLSGTANEQAVSCGKPVVAFPTKGSQYNERFVAAQKKLLGESLAVTKPIQEDVSRKVLEILHNDSLYQSMSKAGIERMGEKGGAERIALEISRLI